MWLCHPSCLHVDLNLIHVEQRQFPLCLWTKVLIIPSSQQSRLCPKTSRHCAPCSHWNSCTWMLTLQTLPSMDTFWSHQAVTSILAGQSCRDRECLMGMSVLPAPAFPQPGERREIQGGESWGHRMVWNEKVGSPAVHHVAPILQHFQEREGREILGNPGPARSVLNTGPFGGILWSLFCMALQDHLCPDGALQSPDLATFRQEEKEQSEEAVESCSQRKPWIMSSHGSYSGGHGGTLGWQ